MRKERIASLIKKYEAAVFWRTGCHKPGEPVFSTDNEHLVVDPDCFPIGMNIMVSCALKYLEQNK